MFRIIKKYPHSLGLSCCYRQRQSNTHCSLLHGYALSFSFCFESETLDSCGHVVDFGRLHEIQLWLISRFDHVLLWEKDDELRLTPDKKVASIRYVDYSISLENIAKELFFDVTSLIDADIALLDEAGNRKLKWVECSEHEGNSARYTP